MWSNFFVQQDDDGRMGVAGGGGLGVAGGVKGVRGGGPRRQKMSDSLEGKIKLAFFLSIVGVTLAVLGVGTEFWAELAQPKYFMNNQTCQVAHYGLWKGCVKTLPLDQIDLDRPTCGPTELRGGEPRPEFRAVSVCVCASVRLSICPSYCPSEEVSVRKGNMVAYRSSVSLPLSKLKSRTSQDEAVEVIDVKLNTENTRSVCSAVCR